MTARLRAPAPASRRSSMVPVSTPGDRLEREADLVADAVARGERASGVHAGQPASPSTVQRSAEGRHGGAVDADGIGRVVRSGGRPLEDDTRSLMEDRLGFDLSRVRVHTDGQAAESARAVRARAYTIGSDVVFGADQYAPRSREGQRLLAHELTHVRQQASGPPMLQRWSIFDEIGGWFAGDTFDTKTLTAYIAHIDKKGAGEGHSDSDNKARAIVAAWKKDRTAFALDARLKALLIKEMQSGFCGDSDELAILDLLTSATDDELTHMFTKEGLSPKQLDSDLDFAENDKLHNFFAARFKGGLDGAKKHIEVKSGGDQPAKAETQGKVTPEKPRLDYVFIMGNTKKDGFYKYAERYFRMHYPNAEMIVTERTLDAILWYIDREIQAPIGNLYIVSHGNEDGTLSFGLDESDTQRNPAKPKSLHGDSHLSPIELRDALHPPGGGKSTLRDVTAKIDEKTVIRIRGCDLGQNKEFVNLIDEAFGGKGQVIASTHEQRYGIDSELEKQSRAKAKKAIEDSEPLPPPIDPAIKDRKAKQAAMRERDKALKERKARIDQKLKERKDEIDEAAQVALSYESMSGVVLQRPGRKKFTEKEVTAEMDRRYQHLTEKQRAKLVASILKGQKVDTQTFPHFTGQVPSNSAQALAVFGPSLKKAGFTPDRKQAVDISTTKHDDGTESKKYRFHDAQGGWADSEVSDIPADEAAMIREAQRDSPNPQNFTWEVKRDRQGAQLAISVVATRVFADLHHQSLDARPHQPFAPGEDNPLFYVKSTFEPEDPKKVKKKDEIKGAKK